MLYAPKTNDILMHDILSSIVKTLYFLLPTTTTAFTNTNNAATTISTAATANAIATSNDNTVSNTTVNAKVSNGEAG